MSYKYILFDLDGTLTDPREGITKSVQYALNHFGIKVDDLESLNKFIGPPLIDAFMEFYGLSEKDSHTALEVYRERFKTIGWKENIILPKAAETLKRLSENGYRVCLATSKPYIFASKIIKLFDIEKYFDLAVGSELDGTRTDKKDVIEYILEKMNITDKSEALMVGDRKHDIIGAKAAGIKSVGVLFGFGSKEELTDAGADYIISDFDELFNIF